MSNPATLVEAFDGSLGAFTGTDPIRYDDGLWLEEGTTNIARNPSAETNTTDYAAWGSGITLAQDATHPAVGTNGVKVTHSGTNASGVQLTCPSSAVGVTFTAQARVWAPVGLNLRIGLWGFYTDASNAQIGSYVTFTGTGALQLVTVTGTSNGAKTLASIRPQVILNGAQSAGDFWVDAIQAEAKGYATSYADGAQGSGYAWTSTAHASTSTRAASSAAIDPTGILDSLEGSLAFRYTRKLDTGTTEMILEAGENTAGYDHLQIFIDSDTLWIAWDSEGGLPQTIDTGQTMAVDTEYFIYTYWSGLTFGVSIDNGTAIVASRDVPTGDWGTNDLVLGP